VQALQVTPGVEAARLEAAIEARDRMAESAPALSGPILVEAAARARDQGRLIEAIEMLEKAVKLPLSDEERARSLCELGDVSLEAGQIAEASQHYTAALPLAQSTGDLVTLYNASLGLAEVDRRGGEPTQAARRLEALHPPDDAARATWLELRAAALGEAGELEAAIDVWKQLADLAEDDRPTRAAALRGRADLLLGADRPGDALPLYEEAASTSPDPGEVGAARLGAAEAQFMLGQEAKAKAAWSRLQASSDPEVALQARLRQASLANTEERWDDALALLAGVNARTLGSGWDATVTSIRVSALTGAERPVEAVQAWTELSRRWPEDPEALIPAWLGLGDLALAAHDTEEALRHARRVLEESDDPAYRERAQTLITQAKK
jgi:tetratricopeptide (TPR) repeat protein